jgi:hypothetical protein
LTFSHRFLARGGSREVDGAFVHPLQRLVSLGKGLDFPKDLLVTLLGEV